MARRILILGGTTEARELAAALADRAELDVRISLAGRTARIVPQPVPLRIGGFGGIEGLAQHLADERIDALIDATHPFASQISRHAAEAARARAIPFVALRRPEWSPRPGDRWTPLDDVDAAVAALGAAPRRVFLALGRKEIAPFERAPGHFYLVRSVDPVEPPLAVREAVYVLERGPFSAELDRKLLEQHRIDVVVARNSGGDAAYAKIAAARALGLSVLMLRRPAAPDVPAVASVAEAVAWLAHVAGPAERGV
jgi:precorrin-6A/cobalt-precorrin-6A reductase